jgi:hypothetical protein
MNPYDRFRRLIRLGLLAASLLYVLGAAAEPVVHLIELAHAAETEDRNAPAEPNTDLCCFVCTTLAGAAPAIPPSTVPVAEIGAAVVITEVVAAPAKQFFLRKQPRAPPAAL